MTATANPRILMTGATGVVGRRVAFHLAHLGYGVIGVARHRPDWWLAGHEFRAMDLLSDDVSGLQDTVRGAKACLHACDLGRQDTRRNREASLALFKICIAAGVSHFLYFSSIRVYARSVGAVDESSVPRPADSDPYGCCKLDIEHALEAESAPATGLTILRLGNVFSEHTPQKFPTPKDRVTRWILRGMNPHLISDGNVAYAVGRILELGPGRTRGVINVTQELDGANDFFALAEPGAVPARVGRLGLSLRAALSRRRGEVSAGYFNRVLERRLNSLGVTYPGMVRDHLERARQGVSPLLDVGRDS